MRFQRQGGHKWLRAFINVLFEIDHAVQRGHVRIAKGLRWLTGKGCCFYARRALIVGMVAVGVGYPLREAIEGDWFFTILNTLATASFILTRLPQRLLGIVSALERWYEEGGDLPLTLTQVYDLAIWRLWGVALTFLSILAVEWTTIVGWGGIMVGLYLAGSGEAGGKSLRKRVMERLKEKLPIAVPVGT